MENKELNKIEHFRSTIIKFAKGISNKAELRSAITIFETVDFEDMREAFHECWSKEETVTEKPSPDTFNNILAQIHHRINLEQEIKERQTKQKRITIFSKIAAILIIGIFIGLLVPKLKSIQPVYYTTVSPKGSVSQLLLPDSSIVYLNSGSKIKYAIDGEEHQREIFLDGEAWFDVAKDKRKTFVVHTGFYNVEVHGTKFNIKSYSEDDEIVTTLEEGSISITSQNGKSYIEPVMLVPNQQIVYNQKQNTYKVKKVNPLFFSSWKENKLIFINMSLKELIALLERKYSVEIKVADKSILDYHYDGTIKGESILEVLDLLKATLPVQYRIEGQTIQIIKNRGGKGL